MKTTGMIPRRSAAPLAGRVSTTRAPARMMRILSILAVIGITCLALAVERSTAQTPTSQTNPTERFAFIDVFVDPVDQPLAAYQVEVVASSNTKIVSLEGGEHAAFKAAPFYDPSALNHNRIILAAYHTGEDLPAARTRVARLHVQVSGAVEAQVKLMVAGSNDARPIPARVTSSEGEAR